MYQLGEVAAVGPGAWRLLVILAPRRGVRFPARHVMTQKIDPLIARLIERLSDPDASVRRNAAGALRLHGARAVAAARALQRLLDDQDPIVRREAARALDQLRRVAA